MREIAIIKIHNVDIKSNIIDKLPEQSSITIFMSEKDNDIFEVQNKSINVVRFPEDKRDKLAELKNTVSKHFFDKNFKGMLHVIEDSVLIYNDPTAFMDGIDQMLVKMKMKSWLNTITDVCNYTLFQYNPRIAISIDKEDAKNIYDKTIYWTSHANTSWICYNYGLATFDDIRFNEEFRIPMYFIIQFLADRRNNKKPGEPYFMNYYPTIEEEKNVFKIIDVEGNVTITQEDYQKEDDHFKSLNINHEGDSSVDQLIQSMYDSIMS